MYSRRFKNRYYSKLKWGEKIPRKAKKYIMGKKLSKCKVKRMIKAYKHGDDGFCPNCGSCITHSTHNMAEYPEVWIKHYCIRCGELVAYEDNSPLISVLDEYIEEK